MTTVHLVVFPNEVLWIWVASECFEPWSHEGVVDAVAIAFEQLHAVLELVGIERLKRVECLACVVCEDVAVESVVFIAREERKSDVAQVFCGSILERFATGHRACGSKVVGVE